MDDLIEGNDGFYGELDERVLENEEEISQEEVWDVIDKYFAQKGLVGQQVDSFDFFLRHTMQELIDDAGEIAVTPEDQFIPDKNVEEVRIDQSINMQLRTGLQPFAINTIIVICPCQYPHLLSPPLII